MVCVADIEERCNIEIRFTNRNVWNISFRVILLGKLYMSVPKNAPIALIISSLINRWDPIIPHQTMRKKSKIILINFFLCNKYGIRSLWYFDVENIYKVLAYTCFEYTCMSWKYTGWFNTRNLRLFRTKCTPIFQRKMQNYSQSIHYYIFF